jgi:hypothetical protein
MKSLTYLHDVDRHYLLEDLLLERTDNIVTILELSK